MKWKNTRSSGKTLGVAPLINNNTTVVPIPKALETTAEVQFFESSGSSVRFALRDMINLGDLGKARESLPCSCTDRATPSTKLEAAKTVFKSLIWLNRESNPACQLWWCVQNTGMHGIMRIGQCAAHRVNAGRHDLFTISGRMTFIFMNFGRQWVQDIFVFALLLFCFQKLSLACFNALSLAYFHTCLAVFLQSIFIQHTMSFY